MSEPKWGLSYARKASAIVSKDGLKPYHAKFMREGSTRNAWEECTLIFWAKKPGSAVKQIINSGKCPVDFHQQEVIT